MKSILGWAWALSTFILAGTARAQAAPPAWYPQQYPAHISIQAAPLTELEVVPSGAAEGSAPVARCTEYCEFWATPGKYTLYARDHAGTRKDLSLRIKQSSRFELQAGDDDARAGGLALGIGGSAAILTGLIMILPAVMSAGCHGDCKSDGEQTAAAVGLGVLLAGAIATPVGWSVYASNRTRLKRIDEGSYQPKEPISQVRVGVVGLGLGGLGLGGTVTF